MPRICVIYRPALACCCLFALVALAPARADERIYPEASHAGGELRYIEGIPVAILQGSPEEIGAQHAALVLEPGEKLLSYPETYVASKGGEGFWPVVVDASKVLWQQSPPRYQRELAALVQNKPEQADTVSVANALLELRRLGCSTLLVDAEQSATGTPLFGRNFDFDTLGMLDKYSLVMIVRPEQQRAFAAVTFPGLVGLFSGMNDAGLAVATLDISESADDSPRFEMSGAPLALVYRRILEECETIDQAEQLLRSITPTTWVNLAMCDRHGGAVFEITPQTIVRRDSSEGILPCTNHFRSEQLAVDQTCWRYDKLLGAAGKLPLDVAGVLDHLHQANQGERTLQTMVFEPRELVLHVSLGPLPSTANPLRRLDLKPLFKPTATTALAPAAVATP